MMQIIHRSLWQNCLSNYTVCNIKTMSTILFFLVHTLHWCPAQWRSPSDSAAAWSRCCTGSPAAERSPDYSRAHWAVCSNTHKQTRQQNNVRTGIVRYCSRTAALSSLDCSTHCTAGQNHANKDPIWTSGVSCNICKCNFPPPARRSQL